MVSAGPHDCPYLAGRLETSRALWASRMPGDLYHRFMDAGFRRSGRIIYQPVCRGCRACQPIRVPVETFRPGKSQRRTFRRNGDLVISVGPPESSEERFALYQRYSAEWHGRVEQSREDFDSFLYDSPVDTLEFTYRSPAGRLLAVGICDVCPASLSSVYYYFDPAESRRSLGTLGALVELDFARRHRLSHYYLGYWIEACDSMRYKSDFRPCEVLCTDGVWRSLDSHQRSRKPTDLEVRGL